MCAGVDRFLAGVLSGLGPSMIGVRKLTRESGRLLICPQSGRVAPQHPGKQNGPVPIGVEDVGNRPLLTSVYSTYRFFRSSNGVTSERYSSHSWRLLRRN
ncbi:hypothetical protein GCM10009664_03860 [Kitasatospora gansuensis]